MAEQLCGISSLEWNHEASPKAWQVRPVAKSAHVQSAHDHSEKRAGVRHRSHLLSQREFTGIKQHGLRRCVATSAQVWSLTLSQ